MVNKVTLIGYLGADPEVRRLENGAAVARLNVATNESYRDKNNEWQTITDWHNVICWRHLAEKAEASVKKGSLVYVEGRLTTRKWQDKDGNDRYTTEVVANYFRSLDRRDADNSYSGGRFPSAADAPPAQQQANQPAPAKPVSNEPASAAQPASEPVEDDLPF